MNKILLAVTIYLIIGLIAALVTISMAGVSELLGGNLLVSIVIITLLWPMYLINIVAGTSII